MAISKRKPDQTILDFTKLRQEGIAIIEQMAGKIWTDYNEHDPGITILEQLCYALTDLGYRMNLPMPELLSTGQQDPDALLYTLDEVMPSYPVTIDDIRKTVIGIDGVKNAWVSVAPPVYVGKQKIKGLYNIHVCLESKYNIDDSEVKDRIGREAYKRLIRATLLSTRNLCEDVLEIIILQQQPLALKQTEIELEVDANPDEVLAQVYYELDKYLSQNVQFYTLDNLMDKGMDVNDIYEGPVTPRGFILNQFLFNKLTHVPYSKIINIILSVDGVKSVRKLSIASEGHIVPAIDVPEHKTPFIVLPDESTIGDIVIIKNNLKVSYRTFGLRNEFFGLKARLKRQYDLNIDQHRQFKVPDGAIKNLKQYFSIQNQFPQNYGIGKKGGQGVFSKQRQAQIKQLKGYLLIFEQFLADYLAQIENVKQLFSANDRLNKTYYYQFLDNNKVPEIEHLLKERGSKTDEKAFFSIEMTEKHHNESYREGLMSAYRRYDNFTERRNQILDHLLARFGESFLSYDEDDFNYYYSKEDFAKYQIAAKTEFLKNYIPISRGKGQGVDYTSFDWDKGLITGLDKRLQLLLGLVQFGNTNKYAKRSLADIVLDRRIWFKSLPDRHDGFYHHEKGYNYPVFVEFDKKHVKPPYDSLENLEYDLYHKEGVSKQELSKEGHVEDLIIDEDLLHFGFKKENLWIKEMTPADDERIGSGLRKAHSHPYALIFYNERSGKCRNLGEYKSKLELVQAAGWMTDYIKRLNQESEGYHLIEHLLLRPLPVEGDDELKKNFKLPIHKYRIELFDEHNELMLVSTRYFEEGDHFHHRYVEDMLKSGSYYINFYSVKTEDDKYSIEVRDEHAALIATCPRHFDTLQDSVIHYLVLHNFCKRLLAEEGEHRRTHLYEKHIRYHRIPDFADYLPDDFYSMTVSVVLPNWTARFQDKEYLNLLRQTFRENIPAHIFINFIMLNPWQMHGFERDYRAWLELRSDTDSTKKDINKASFTLTERLADYIINTPFHKERRRKSI